MLALYLLSLAASAGAVGLFAYQVLAGQGFVPAFSAGLYLAAGAAFLYVTLQVLYMAVVRIYKPTRDSAPLFIEVLSHAGALALLPYLLHMRLPLPSSLTRFEPLAYLALFLAPHAVFKLMSFFAAVRGAPGPRAGGLVWVGAACTSMIVAYIGLSGWMASMELLRPEANQSTDVYRVGGQSTLARELPEGAQARLELVSAPGQAVEFLWAPDPAMAPDQVPSRVYASITLEGARTSRTTQAVEIVRNGWSSLRLAPEDVPEGATRCRIVWNAGKEPLWQKLSGVTPVITSSRRLLVAGPQVRLAREAKSPANLVIVMVDGLNANRIGKEGSMAAKVAPSLSRFAGTSTQFTNAYSPAPESAATVVSLMTGATPLRHGYLGAHRGYGTNQPKFLAERLRDKGYATAAFTEGKAEGLEYGSGIEQGFDLYDDLGTEDPESGIQITAAGGSEAADSKPSASPVDGLGRASAWLDQNKSDQTFAFVRLRGLERAVKRDNENDPGNITVDSYDSALRLLDRELGKFIGSLQDGGNTCILLAGTFGAQGLADDTIPASDRLAEVALHVPCILYVPGQKAFERKEVISLEDITAAVLRVVSDDSDFLYGESRAAGTDEAVSVSGSPLALSIRSGGWRLTWQTPVLPFTPLPTMVTGGHMALYDVELVRKGRRPVDAGPRNGDAVARLHQQLIAYLQVHANNR